MRDDRSYLNWCCRQNKGIRLTKPSENLVKAYLKKSMNALKSMEINADADLDDWAVSASYYSKYFAVYALLSKLGVKCEIHDCTITLFEYLFKGSVPDNIIKDLRNSKEDRVEFQYYTQEINVDLDEVQTKTKRFVLEIEKVIDGLNTEKIAGLQETLRALTKSTA
ncbi:MAG: HEPN domain-containing protein [Candidatus Bathyarchaeota archaeon]|nr:HEPN domain-containing protein [Candidatus Bathyarchaeota archaeon]